LIDCSGHESKNAIWIKDCLAHELTSATQLSSRMVAQLFYFLFAYKQAKSKGKGEIFFQLPSGKFGISVAGIRCATIWECR